MNSASESFEPVPPQQAAAGSRRGHGRGLSAGLPTAFGSALKPHAVDAVFANETEPLVPNRGSRRELTATAGQAECLIHKVDVPHVAKPAEYVSDLQATRLLQSLGRQIEAVREQQEHIRRLIDQVERYASCGNAQR